MKSFLSYFGGKSRLVSTIVPRIPAHTTYVEVFAGGCWVLFGKEESHVEVVNDINKDLITLYRVVKCHLEEFVRYFKWSLISRDEFERLKSLPPDSLTDIQRAARYFYLLKCGYASKNVDPSFCVSGLRKPRLNLLRVEEILSEAHIRLARVWIESVNYDRLISRYDSPETFFYVDPPYWGHENDYGKGIFSRDMFPVLSEQLKGIKGQFLLSINDTPEVRQVFSPFHIQEVATTYSSKKGDRGVSELLISNYEYVVKPS